MKLCLDDIKRCLHGVLPSTIATVSGDGVPNVTYLSHVYYLDTHRVALSCQFFNKTRANVAENPYASLQLYDPITFEAYRMELRYLHSEYEGPLFERMRDRLDAIASHTGMTGVFRLLSADVYEVLEIEPVDHFLAPRPTDTDPELEQPDATGPMTEVRGVQRISAHINAARTLEELLDRTLDALHRVLGFEHSMLLLLDEREQWLFTVASHGYGESGVGAEVRVGDGLVGMAAAQKRVIRAAGLATELRYGRAIRQRALALGHLPSRPEVPLPGLPDAQSQMALPLVVRERLLGVLAVESRHPLRFDQWDEAFLDVITNQVALAIDAMTRDDNEPAATRLRAESAAKVAADPSPVQSATASGSSDDIEPAPVRLRAASVAEVASDPDPAKTALTSGDTHAKHTFWFFPNDDCVFVDGEYLVRNIPGKILWKLLQDFHHAGRREFSNRELRLDASLGLPPLKDNLESRLILLRRRLEDKCAHVRLVPVKRGRFALEVRGALELVERSSSSC